MKQFGDVDALDSVVEKIVRDKVQRFYTDWKNHDRPKYMGFKNSHNTDDKDLILIVRECGTELLTKKKALEEGTVANTVYTYYREQEALRTDFYNVNLNQLTIEKMVA